MDIFVAVYASGDHSKMGGKHFSSFYSKVCMPVTHVLNIYLCIIIIFITFWVLTNFPFGFFIFKVLYGSGPEVLEFQYGFRSKLLRFTHFQWSKPTV